MDIVIFYMRYFIAILIKINGSMMVFFFNFRRSKDPGECYGVW